MLVDRDEERMERELTSCDGLDEGQDVPSEQQTQIISRY